jgi:DNA-binding response OmpR family regulator
MPPRLNQDNLRKATVYIGEKNYYERQLLREMFLAQGLKQIVCHSTLDALRDMLFEVPPDLLVLAADFDPRVFEFIREIRMQRIGENPFMLITMMVAPTQAQALSRGIEVGVDDIIIKPISAERIQERLRLVTFHRRPFIAVDGYVGPERKTEEPRPQGVRRIPVINTLLEKVNGREMDKFALKAAVEGSLQKVLHAQLDSQSFRLGEVCERLVTAYETRAIGDDVQTDLMTLAGVLKDAAAVAARLKDEQLSSLCRTLADNVDHIAQRYAEPTPQDIDLIRKITAAFKMAMKTPSRPELEAAPDGIDLGQYQ